MKQALKNLTFLRISMIFKIEYERTAVGGDANRSKGRQQQQGTPTAARDANSRTDKINFPLFHFTSPFPVQLLYNLPQWVPGICRFQWCYQTWL